MQFLVANHDTTARIFGHTYLLKGFRNPLADWKDILVADDAATSDLLRHHKESLSSAALDQDQIADLPAPLSSLDQIKNGNKILLLRSGGIGDHIMLLPALKAFRNRLKDQSVTIQLSVQEDMFPIFQGNNDIDHLYPLPLSLSDMLMADFFIDFSGSLEKALNNDLHLTDYFMRAFHLNRHGAYDMNGLVSGNLSNSSLIITLFSRLKKMNPGRRIIFLNWRASTRIKSLPPYLFAEITKQSKDIIFVAGHPNSFASITDEEISKHNLQAINISSHLKTLYDYFTAVSLSDMVICSDTSTYHIASLYQKPSMVITGPTYPVLTKYYPRCIAIEARYHGDLCQAPCGRVRGECPEAQRLKTPFSPCLMSISPREVASEYHHFV
ncbi:MAG: hypothetical protein JW932_19525 [Deltaproteobacteria bacterium]|nr:hypothetical protein [Deltaproteobacteria bacterium]